jgi:hypothetical protein
MAVLALPERGQGRPKRRQNGMGGKTKRAGAYSQTILAKGWVGFATTRDLSCFLVGAVQVLTIVLARGGWSVCKHCVGEKRGWERCAAQRSRRFWRAYGVLGH